MKLRNKELNISSVLTLYTEMEAVSEFRRNPGSGISQEVPDAVSIGASCHAYEKYIFNPDISCREVPYEHGIRLRTHGSVDIPFFQASKLVSGAKIPARGSKDSAGFDLYALEAGCLAPKMRLAISTGISIAIPRGWYGRVAPRSGLAHNFGIDVLAGVIDADYRGEVKVILINNGSGDYKFEAGDRIAQLIPEFCGVWQIQEVTTLDETTRGEGGFGSTGK